MPVNALADTNTVDIGSIVTGMSNEMLTGISTTITSLTPIIVTCVLIGFAIRAFKKYVK